MKVLDIIALVLVIIGAINWGLIGVLDVDLVALIFGVRTIFTRIVYTLVGICGIVNIGILMSHLDFKRD